MHACEKQNDAHICAVAVLELNLISDFLGLQNFTCSACPPLVMLCSKFDI